MLYACHPKLHKRLRLEGSWLQDNLQAKKFVRPHLNGKMLGVVAHAYHPSDGKEA
jgi:hypothetical protein